MLPEPLALVAAPALGITSLFVLLLTIRQKSPAFFAPDGRKLLRVINAQSNLGASLIYSPSQGLSSKRMPQVKVATSRRKRFARISVRRLLKYSQWRISPLIFHVLSCMISAGIFVVLGPHTNMLVKLACVCSGPIIMRGVLIQCVARRSNRFDADYPQFLLAVVGLLKTGLTSTGALQAAADGLDERSLVREEVFLMLERIKVGVLEDQSIGSFGEHILHPEIELFVQALLLSNKLGGTLSESLERLSRQVRRRQFFKSSAKAAVGLQRGSLCVVSVILIALQVYLAWIVPDLVQAGMNSDFGWHVWQAAGLCIVVAFLWVRRITNIKV
jgi:Flp pilus assembly protein TadB